MLEYIQVIEQSNLGICIMHLPYLPSFILSSSLSKFLITLKFRITTSLPLTIDLLYLGQLTTTG